MAKITITLSDELAELYQGYLLPGALLEALLVRQLEKFKDADPRNRFIVVRPDTRIELEKVLYGGHLLDDRDLVKKVKNLASIKIGHVELLPSPAQMRDLERRATKNNRSPQEEAEVTFKKMAQMFFGVV